MADAVKPAESRHLLNLHGFVCQQITCAVHTGSQQLFFGRSAEKRLIAAVKLAFPQVHQGAHAPDIPRFFTARKNRQPRLLKMLAQVIGWMPVFIKQARRRNEKSSKQHIFHFARIIVTIEIFLLNQLHLLIEQIG